MDKAYDAMETSVERKPVKGAVETLFILSGFSQTAGIRVYAFECLDAGRRTDFTVAVDLALISGYGIRIQDLPLLCRELLQQRTGPSEIAALMFTEQDMRTHAETRATAREDADRKKKTPRRPANPNLGSNWRSNFR